MNMTAKEAAKILDSVIDHLVGTSETVDRVLHAAWMGATALRDSAPRVMTLEDYQKEVATPYNKRNVQFLHEQKDECGSHAIYGYDKYGIKWRVWSVGRIYRPTAEQMQATPWEVEG